VTDHKLHGLSSNQPYLIRALYEWLLDNELTPHLLVEVLDNNVVVPHQYVEDDRIVLNISPSAVKQLELGNELITFNARFGGSAMKVIVPIAAVLGIYAKESGHGMLFPREDGSPEDEPQPPDAPQPPSLKVVK
jgi:stringent starvation protein B